MKVEEKNYNRFQEINDNVLGIQRINFNLIKNCKSGYKYFSHKLDDLELAEIAEMVEMIEGIQNKKMVNCL